DAAPPGEVGAGQGLLVLQQALVVAGVHDVPAVLPGTGTDVDDPVGGQDGVFVVLDDDQGVAQVTQPGQGVQQTAVVPLVQADTGFVQYVQHAHQARADLGGQPDPLGFAAGEGGRCAGHGQVAQADVEQEPEPGVDLPEHLGGDGCFAFAELHPVQERLGVLDGQVAQFGDGLPAHAHREHLGLEPGAAAGGAWHLAHVP